MDYTQTCLFFVLYKENKSHASLGLSQTELTIVCGLQSQKDVVDRVGTQSQKTLRSLGIITKEYLCLQECKHQRSSPNEVLQA